ncbi:MAG TPA: mycofactocin precursor MftA [Acidimicrobiales bacterium]|nr:mycofactocin precursor MftA [Acidimicrobiales bacterium]
MTATTAQDINPDSSGRTSPDSTLTVAADVGPRVRTDAGAAPLVEEDLLVEDLLVEDVSIDGMCGVY